MSPGAAMRPFQRRVWTDGLTFRVIESPGPSAAAAPVVVLIHGIGMSHRYLSRLHGEVAKSARVISIDMPGFAGLPRPASDPDVPQMAAALCRVLGSLGADHVVLVGHSMGAQWAIEAAVQRPVLVAAVVAIGPVVDSRYRTPLSQARALALDTVGETPLINFIVFSDYLRCGIRWYLRQVKHMLAYPTEQRIHDVAAPVLLIRGGSDPVAGREWCRRLRDGARVSRSVEIPRHHHVVQHSAPRAVAAVIRHHMTGLGQVEDGG